MPLWDSVQRSLEKASQEAARIAKTQRLRSTIDGLSRQISIQNNTILNKTMDLFIAGQLTQNELLPLCQEVVNLQQQLNQAQMELKQLQSSQAQNTPTMGTQLPPGTAPVELPHPYPPPVPGSGAPATFPQGDTPSETVYAPPPPAYQPYPDNAQVGAIPPPPPGIEPLTVSSIKTLEMNTGAMSPGAPAPKRICTVCHAELFAENAFCQNCGAPVQDSHAQHSPTMRSGTLEVVDPGSQATVRAQQPASNPPEPANLPPSGPSPDESKRNEGV